MIDSRSVVRQSPALPFRVPIVSLAAVGGRASGGWFQTITERLQACVPPRNVLSARHLHLSNTIVELKRMVAEMKKELLDTQERETRAQYLAFHDDLTTLPNRRAFRECLERALAEDEARSSILTVIYLDLDGFKALNDAHGHDTGDRLLNLVAVRLTHALRSNDLVARLGGDEYACLIPGMPGRDRLQQILKTLYEAVSQPFKIDRLMLSVRPSIGIAVYPRDGQTADELLAAADRAMYAAKRARPSRKFTATVAAQS